MPGLAFKEEYFVSTVVSVAAGQLKLVANNMFYLCLASVNQKMRERSLGLELGNVMTPCMDQPQPLRLKMYRSPEPSFTKNFIANFLFMSGPYKICFETQLVTPRGRAGGGGGDRSACRGIFD